MAKRKRGVRMVRGKGWRLLSRTRREYRAALVGRMKIPGQQRHTLAVFVVR